MVDDLTLKKAYGLWGDPKVGPLMAKALTEGYKGVKDQVLKV